MKFKFTIIGAYLFIIAILFGCEEKINWNYQSNGNSHIAITAILTNENKIQTVEIYQSSDIPEETPLAIIDADVRIYTNDNSINFSHDQGKPGTYKSPVAFAAPANKAINIEILHEDQLYQASTQMGTVAPIPPIQIDINQSTGRRFIKKVADIYSPVEQAMYQLELDWSGIEPDTINRALLFAYTFSTVDISGILQPNEEDISFPSSTIIVEKKFGLTPDYAEFLRSLVIETNWQGGFFDEAQSSLQSNISNNALGYFTACQILSDTIIVQ